MIKFHRDSRFIFWILIVGLALNIIWSFRLELQAKNINNIVESYHSNLNNNYDILRGLNEFIRTAEMISISTNDQKIKIEMTPSQDGINIGVGDEMISIGKLITPFSTFIDPASLGFLEGIILQASEGIRLNLGKHNTHFFNMDRDGNLLEMRLRDMFFKIGNTVGRNDFYEGILMGEGNYATIGISKREGIKLFSEEIIKFEGQKELQIVSDGDINIRSENGAVRINGKKIYMDNSE
jgi:hypothetical protein